MLVFHIFQDGGKSPEGLLNANNLYPHVKKRYYEKISYVGIHPILIPDKAYDPDCLPRVESMDFWLSFLVLETS